jgi:hypothetical protein
MTLDSILAREVRKILCSSQSQQETRQIGRENSYQLAAPQAILREKAIGKKMQH